MQPFPLLFVKFETVYGLKAASNFLQAIRLTESTIKHNIFSKLFFLTVQDITQLFYTVFHTFLNLVALHLGLLLISLLELSLAPLFTSMVTSSFFETRFNASESWRVLLIDLDDDCVVVLADSFETGAHYWQADIVLAWPNLVVDRLVRQLSTEA